MSQINFEVKPEVQVNFVKPILQANFPDIDWIEGKLPNVDIVFVFDESKVNHDIPTLFFNDAVNEAEFVGGINKAIRKGLVILPTELGCEVLLAQMHDSVSKLKKLRDNNPLLLRDHEIISQEYVDAKTELAGHLLHPTAMKRYAPALEEILSARVYRTLQRKVPRYVPLAPMTDDPDINSLYPNLPKSGEELGVRIDKVADKIKALGITPSVSVLDYSQLNLGIPFPGGMHRETLNLKDPDDELIYWMKDTAKFMLRGLARKYKDDPEDFENDNVRVGVKVNNFQGAITCTRSHAIRQTIWAIMERNGNDIFYFADMLAVAASGFRTQSNGGGKKRSSYVILDQNVVAKSRVIDGEDLKNAAVALYKSVDASGDETFVDSGVAGGRERYVANIESAQNDGALAVPAYLAKYKDKAYKVLYQQDKSILSRFVTGSDEFISFWVEGYNSWSLLREKAKQHFGLSNIDEFIEYIVDHGEYVLCGDVQNYDASATWDFTKHFTETLVSEKVYDLMDKLYHTDKVGVYTDHKGEKRFYYITCNNDPSFPKHHQELVNNTRKAMSSLPSGLAMTAQMGRGPVAAVLKHLAQRCLMHFGLSKVDAISTVSWMPNSDEEFSFFFASAFMNDGGDDHNLGMLILHLLTGVSVEEIISVFERLFEDYEFLSLLPEYPKMNCGYKFHDDEKGRCTSVSLSETRMYDNTLYPEYPRGALGLHSSVTNYIESAIDTPLQDTMIQLAQIIVVDIYGFESFEDLAILAASEDQYLIHNHSDQPARQQIANILGIPENDLEWQYTIDDLLALGIDDDLINQYRKPIPASLTRNPGKFFNLETIKQIIGE